MKTTTAITIDTDALARAKELGINISGMLNDYLKVLVAQESKDISGIDSELLNLQIQKKQTALQHIQTELTGMLEQKKAIETRIEVEKEETLRLEKEKIDSAKHCSICGELAVFKSNTFAKGVVCHACYLNPAYSKKIRELM